MRINKNKGNVSLLSTSVSSRCSVHILEQGFICRVNGLFHINRVRRLRLPPFDGFHIKALSDWLGLTFHLRFLSECASINSDTWGRDTLQGNVVVTVWMYFFLWHTPTASDRWTSSHDAVVFIWNNTANYTTVNSIIQYIICCGICFIQLKCQCWVWLFQPAGYPLVSSPFTTFSSISWGFIGSKVLTVYLLLLANHVICNNVTIKCHIQSSHCFLFRPMSQTGDSRCRCMLTVYSKFITGSSGLDSRWALGVYSH